MRLPAIWNEAAAVFGRVSVVQMASDTSANERAEERRCRARRGTARKILSSASGTPMAPVAQLAFPAFTTTARMRPFDARKCSLEISTGAATTRFCVNTPAADAGTSLERIAKSSAPVFFKPQAVAAKRKARGREASERACCILGGVMA